LESIILVYVVIATSIVVLVPLTMPTVKAQVSHVLGSAQNEDGIFPYDVDGTKDGVVHWDPNKDHWIMTDYTVEDGYTLDIPALDFTGNPDTGNEITFKNGAQKIEVWGTMLTNPNSVMPPSWTAFMGDDGATWEGIIFRPGSQGNIQDCSFSGAKKGVRFFPAAPPSGLPPSVMLYPGIFRSSFTDMGLYGVELHGTTGYTNVELCSFTDSLGTAKGMEIYYTGATIKGNSFISHGDNRSQLYIYQANVLAENNNFLGMGKPGNLVYLHENSNGAVFTNCVFDDGNPDDYYVLIEGSSPLIENCSFINTSGELSVNAIDGDFGVTSNPIIRQPSSDYSPGLFDNTFDNSTLNATGNSTIALQWYMNVNVKDPGGRPIDNAPVWVIDRLGDPADPPSHTTKPDGWANHTIITELILHNDTIEYFNPFNVSSLNNSMMGYAIPEPTMNMSKEIFVNVPFNPAPNTPPIISWLPTPSGVQSKLITIDYKPEDPNPADDGNLSIFVEFSTDGSSWSPATSGPGSEFEYLSNNTLYQFIWDSSNVNDLANIYNTTVYIRITPYDRAGPGTPGQTGSFTVDNEPPLLLSMPFLIVTNSTADISWTVHEPADAFVWYGFDPDLTDETSGSTGSTSQSVSLSGLDPGRNYAYVINSTDSVGNKFSSYGKFSFNFATQINIQLYVGWNMISLAPNPFDTSVATQLSSISGQYSEVQIYDSSDPNDPWKHYIPGKPFGNDLTDIGPEDGVWIKMKNDSVLTVNHKVPHPDSPPMTIGLKYGWNLVGYPSAVTRAVDDVLDGVSYDMVQTYDAASNKWYSYDGSSGDLEVMELGRGYWIHATAESNWQVEYD
jgi:hypothetical protein